MHCFKRCLQNIYPVYLFMIYLGNTIRNGILFYVSAKFLPDLFGHLFGIVEQGMKKISGQDHRCGKYGTRKTTPACFVAPCFNPDTLMARL